MKFEMWLIVDGCVGRLFDEINNWCFEIKYFFLNWFYKILYERWENDKLSKFLILILKERDKSSLTV